MLLRGWLPSAIAALALAIGAGIFCLHRQASAVVGGTEAPAPRRIFTSEEIIEFQNKTGQHLLIVVGQVFNVTSGICQADGLCVTSPHYCTPNVQFNLFSN